VSLWTGQRPALEVTAETWPNLLAGGEVPPWVFSLLNTAPGEVASWQSEPRGALSRRADGENKTLWSLRIPHALAMDAAAFEQACDFAYRNLGRRVAESERPFAVRWWNFIPGILEPLGQLEHRYMVFNAGRFNALAAAGSTHFGRLATASGVGHSSDEFVLHCLSAREAGRQIENPRQTPAWHYSQRYGPAPPCFARATLIERGDTKQPWLLVGGTASVLGEDSCHRDHLPSQLEETLRNLAALVGAAENMAAQDQAAQDQAVLLSRYRELRVYYTKAENAEYLENRLRQELGAQVVLEMVPAVLCRPELLVEIEGLAALQARA